MATIDQFLTSLRDEFGEQLAGKKFEVFCKWFLENDPEWSKRIDKVWLWDDYPDKWQRQDLGTDLVFLDKDGLIWAVQAKCYSEHRSTTKGDMNSFLADTGRKEVDKRLWLQTTNKVEATAEKTLKGQDKAVTVLKLKDFCDAQIDYPSSYSELFQAKVKAKPTPDTHQIEAIEAVQLKLRSLDRGQMIMACGTGKTFTTLWIKEALNAHTTLVLLPSLSLLSQTMREWAWAGNTDFDILNVCSDKSVGKKTEDMDPSDTPFPVTSEVDEIARFIKTPNPKVIFCTYQSSPLIAEAQLDTSVPTFDLTIADEAHRCAGKADAGFATVLNGQKIRSAKRLFTTATPRYFGKTIKDEANARDLAVVGMNDETVFGPLIHQLTFGEAISRELLTDYQVVIVGVDEPMVKQWIDDYEIVATNPDEHTDARTLAAKIGLIKAIKDYDLKRVISFHSRVKGAKEFSEELVDVVDLIDPIHRPEGLFLADYVSGEMNAGDRKDKIDRLKVLDGYDRGILTNARCLAEGVDVPSLDGVAFIDPRGSQVEIIQAVGRAIRKVRGAEVQTKGTIVIPVFIEDGDDPEESIEASNFKPVWDVLKALRAHDEILADTLDQYRTNMAKVDSDRRQFISDKIIFDIPMSVDAEFSSALRTFLVEATTESWEFWFVLLESYKAEFGDCLVTRGRKYRNYNLARWVSKQRFNDIQLTSEKRARLDDLGFVWDVYEFQWVEGFKHLVAYKKEYGDCRVVGKFKYRNHTLGNWVGHQRSTRAQLTLEQRNQLDDLGFDWDPYKTDWDEGFEYLVAYKKEYGDCLVQVETRYCGYKLGGWVKTQRASYDQLTPERLKLLDGLGFVRNPAKIFWDRAFELLVAYKEEFGDCFVSGTHKFGDFALGGWVNNQRMNEEKLTSEQRIRLNDLGFVWDVLDYQWEEGFKHLVAYKKEYGDCFVVNNLLYRSYKLGQWVSTQRGKRKDLTIEREIRLKDIGFLWNLDQAKWEKAFKCLVAYKEEFGHCMVTKNTSMDRDFNLSSWVSNQRTNKEKLPTERRNLLNKLGFIWDVSHFKWEEGFQCLVTYKDEFGDCLVQNGNQYSGYKLSQWVGDQRENSHRLTSEQRSRLDGLGFVWNVLKYRWEEGFTNLVDYKDEFGDCRVRDKSKYRNYNLGSWVSKQRSKKGKLTSEQISRLDDLGFVWKTRNQN